MGDAHARGHVVAKKAPRPILPMQLQVGDRFTDEEGKREVISRPWVIRGGKMAHAMVQRDGDPGTMPGQTRAARVPDLSGRPGRADFLADLFPQGALRHLVKSRNQGQLVEDLQTLGQLELRNALLQEEPG